MNTLKYCGFLLLCIIVNFSVISTKLILDSYKRGFLDKILGTLLGECNLGLKNIFIYDQSRGPFFVRTVSNFQPPLTVSIATRLKFLMSLNGTLTKNEVQGVIFIFDPYQAEKKHIIEHVIDRLPLTKNFTTIMIPYTHPRCPDVKPIFLTLKELYIFAAYYICVSNNEPVIFTHNVYGEHRPLLWKVYERKMIGNNMWTLYRRHIRKGTTCEKFHFDRINLKKNSQSANITVGMMSRDRTISLESNYDEVNQKKVDSKFLFQRDIEPVEKLLKMNTLYHYSSEKPVYLYRNTSIDVIFALHFMSHLRPFWHVSHPVSYEEYVILSRNRGFCTPLEKIADFYGFWTCISLIAILIITFFVIWYKTNKNISSATFDILRLLIDDGVNIPINTLSLKIFFSMIFLYFLVIHATFSGHLAEFLTKAKLRKNIDSIEDALIDSRIIDIYNFGFHYSDSSNQEIFDRKSIRTFQLHHCIQKVKNNKSSACIGFESDFKGFLRMKGDEKYYVGKQRLGYMPMSLLYRPRFPFIEKLNSIIIFLVDTRNIGLGVSKRNDENVLILHTKMIRSQVDWRKINLTDVQFAFVLLIIGTSIGLLSFFLELLINHYYHHGCKKKIKRELRSKIGIRKKLCKTRRLRKIAIWAK